jgi:hypothetical protein
MRFRLRTLMIVLALGPPMLAGAWLAAPAIAQAPDPVLKMGALLAVIPVGLFLALATLFAAAYVLVNLLHSRHRFATLVGLALGGPIFLWTVYEVFARVSIITNL